MNTCLVIYTTQKND